MGSDKSKIKFITQYVEGKFLTREEIDGPK